MKPMPPRAYTLIELLVVIGVITALVGVSAVALGGRGGEGAALASAQATLSGLVGSTRAEAVLHQARARLIIHADASSGVDPGGGKYLRMLQVVREQVLDDGTVAWLAAGSPVMLPSPICVVPPRPVPNSHLPPGVTWNNNAATGPVSNVEVDSSFHYLGHAAATMHQFFGVAGAAGRVFHLEFGPDGRIQQAGTDPAKIALTIGAPGGDAPQFNRPHAVRGVIVRRSGAITRVNDPTGF